MTSGHQARIRLLTRQKILLVSSSSSKDCAAPMIRKHRASWQPLPLTSFSIYYQKDGVDNTTYHREFMANVKTIETYGGIVAIGIVPTFVTQQLKAMYDGGTCADFDKPTEIELAATKKSVVCEEFLPV